MHNFGIFSRFGRMIAYSATYIFREGSEDFELPNDCSSFSWIRMMNYDALYVLRF